MSVQVIRCMALEEAPSGEVTCAMTAPVSIRVPLPVPHVLHLCPFHAIPVTDSLRVEPERVEP